MESSGGPSTKSPTSVALHLDLGGFSQSHLQSSNTGKSRKKASSTPLRKKPLSESSERKPQSTEASRQHLLERMKDHVHSPSHRKTITRDSSSRQNLGTPTRRGFRYYEDLSPVGMVVSASKQKKSQTTTRATPKQRSKSVSRHRRQVTPDSPKQRSKSTSRHGRQALTEPQQDTPVKSEHLQRRHHSLPLPSWTQTERPWQDPERSQSAQRPRRRSTSCITRSNSVQRPRPSMNKEREKMAVREREMSTRHHSPKKSRAESKATPDSERVQQSYDRYRSIMTNLEPPETPVGRRESVHSRKQVSIKSDDKKIDDAPRRHSTHERRKSTGQNSRLVRNSSHERRRSTGMQERRSSHERRRSSGVQKGYSSHEHRHSTHERRHSTQEQKQMPSEPETSKFTLTKHALEKNSRAASTQSHWQTAVATCIQMRKRQAIPKSRSVWFQSPTSITDQWQSCYRGYFVRRVTESEIDILKIQNGAMRHVWTGYFCDIVQHLNQIDVTVAQSVVRRKLAMTEFHKAREAAVAIQKLIRQFLALHILQDLREKRRRQWARQVALQKQRDAATTIQTSWRGHSASVDYREARTAVILVQAAVRRFQRRIQRQQDAAVVIQKSWRGYSTFVEYDDFMWSVVTVQSVARRWLTLTRQRHAFEAAQQGAAIVIQKSWRGYAGRVDYVYTVWSAIDIQATFRRYLALSNFETLRTGAIAMQALARGVAGRRATRRKKAQHVAATQQRSASEIQSAWRRYLAITAFQRLVREAIEMQPLPSQRHYFEPESDSYSGKWSDGDFYSSGPEWSEDLSLSPESTIASQSVDPREPTFYPPLGPLEPVAEDQSAVAASESAAVGQPDDDDQLSPGAVAAIAGLSAVAGAATVGGIAAVATQKRDRSRAAVEHRSAVTIQSVVRRDLARSSFKKSLGAATLIQALARGAVGRKEAQKVKAAKSVHLQNQTRAPGSPRHARHGQTFPSFIQSAARRMKNKAICKRRTLAATRIQNVSRRFLAMRKLKVVLVGVTGLSAMYRGAAARAEWARTKYAVVLLQSLYRGVRIRRMFARKRHAAVVIQSVARGGIARVNLLIFHFAASEIQRSWRGSRDRSSQEAMTAAAVRIQSLSRRMLAVKATEKNRRELLLRQASESNPQSSEGHLASIEAEDKIFASADVHSQLLGFESKRRATYAPVLKRSFLQWRSAVDSLQASVQEMVNAERLIFGSAVACDAMMDMSVDGKSYSSEGSSIQFNTPAKRFSFQRGNHQEKHEKSRNPKDGYMEISDEMTLVREELEHKVKVLSELGDTLIAELESAEMGVIEGWDAYDNAAMESFSRDTAVRDQTMASPKHRSHYKTERCTDLWLVEMFYRVSVAFQVLSWQRATAQLSKIFDSMSMTERKHRTRLRELLLVFASRRRQEVSSYASMQGQDLEQLVDQQVDQIHPQIEQLIRETESRPFAETPREFLRVEANDFTTLDSPMASRMLRSSKIIEKRSRRGMRTSWDRAVAVVTADSFVHLFEMSSSSEDISDADEAFHELIIISQLQKLDLHTNLFEGLTPVDSVFLPNCGLKIYPKEKRTFEIREDHVGKLGKVTSHKLQLRTGSPEETEQWLGFLETQGGKF